MEEAIVSHTRKFKQPEKWKHRRFRQPISHHDAMEALEAVLNEYDRISQFDPCTDEESRYHQGRAKIVGAWIIGSMAGGRWTKKSDVDVWLRIRGLSDHGYDYLDWQIKENLLERGKRLVDEHDLEREIDVLIFDYPPSSKYPIIELNLH